MDEIRFSSDHQVGKTDGVFFASTYHHGKSVGVWRVVGVEDGVGCLEGGGGGMGITVIITLYPRYTGNLVEICLFEEIAIKSNRMSW